ncbi:MAG TPA: hypothetical protein VFP65_18290 [Anaeromyxobacteraceae bacterium]|nr:hypothetical protein [Anaeromyxobacteraceae bacterium]
MKIAVRALVALAAMACAALLFVGPSALAPERARPEAASPARCRVVLSGPVAGVYPCTSETVAYGGRLAVVVATPPGARARATLRAELEEVDGGFVQASGTSLRAVVREPEHAGTGNVWTRGGVLAADRPDGGPARLHVVVQPAAANPDRRPVDMEVELSLPPIGAVAVVR